MVCHPRGQTGVAVGELCSTHGHAPEGTSWELLKRMLSYMIEMVFLEATTNLRFNAETKMFTMVKDNAVLLPMITSSVSFWNQLRGGIRGAQSVSFMIDKATEEGVFRSEARGDCCQSLNQTPHTSLAALGLFPHLAHRTDDPSQDAEKPRQHSPQTGRPQ